MPCQRSMSKKKKEKEEERKDSTYFSKVQRREA
jgi:hypothetical protein